MDKRTVVRMTLRPFIVREMKFHMKRRDTGSMPVDGSSLRNTTERSVRSAARAQNAQEDDGWRANQGAGHAQFALVAATVNHQQT